MVSHRTRNNQEIRSLNPTVRTSGLLMLIDCWKKYVHIFDRLNQKHPLSFQGWHFSVCQSLMHGRYRRILFVARYNRISLHQINTRC